jgi:GxxExxY protein
MENERISAEIVDAAVRLHRDLGPGLLESVYERVLAASLSRAGLHVDRQVPVSFEFEGMQFTDAFRLDLLVERTVVVELKSSAQISPVYGKQVLTYLRLMKLEVGLLLNFGHASMKEGIRRIVNEYSPSCSAPPRLRVKSDFED